MTNNEFIKLLAKLVEFKTIPGNFSEIGKCFDFIDSQLGFYPFLKRKIVQNGVESRIWSTSKSKTTEYILNAHIDVVPGDEKFFNLTVSDDNLTGRGVSDMKYAVALYILVLKDIYKTTGKLPSVSLILTSDEEVGGSNGVGHILKQGYKSNIAFVPDGGENYSIVENAKGVLQFDIISKGQGAHGARLWEGKDSIEPLILDILRIRKKFPFPNKKIWKTTVNIGKINGGTQTNQVASSSAASIDVRFVPSERPAEIEKLIKKLVRSCAVKKNILGSAFSIDRNNVYIDRWKNLMNAKFINEDIASDGRYFTEYKIPTIVSKPIGGLIHSPNEWTSINSCIFFGNKLKTFLSNSLR